MGVEPVPETFLRRLLDAYGLQWTHLTIFAGVIFSSFGLQRYLNPGIWILGTVASFGLVLLFRDEITWSFPRVAAVALGIIVAAVAAPIIVLSEHHVGVSAYVTMHTLIVTLYLSFCLGIPVGSTVLAFRAKGDFDYQPLPAELQEIIRRTITRAPFVHRSVNYKLSLAYADEHGELVASGAASPYVRFRWEVVMTVVNRAKRPERYTDLFSRYRPYDQLPYAAVNGKLVDTDDPEITTGRGFVMSYDSTPGEVFTIEVHGQTRLHTRDSELIGSYLPASLFTVRITAPPPGLRVNIHSLVPVRHDAERLANGDMVYNYPDGLLPYQGVRVVWSPDQRDVISGLD